MPDVSVIIPALNAAATLPRLFAALDIAKARYSGTVEVIVADNGSSDGTREMVQAQPDARLVEAPVPGPAAARNAGLRAATGGLLLLLDADCAPEPDWLVAWAETFARNAELMLGGGDLIDAETESLVGRYTAYHGLLEARRFAAGSPTRPGFYLTANFALRRSCLEKLGLFDEAMWPTGEDADLCWRADAAGMKRRFVAEARVAHFHRVSVGGLARQMYKYGFGAAAVQAKWGKAMGFSIEVDWRSWLRLPKALLKLAAAPFRFHGHWRRHEGWLDLVRYASFLAGRWRGSVRYRVVCL